MKASQNGRERPRFKFYQIPHSLSRRLQELTGKVEGELLRLLFNLTLGYGQETIQRSYAQLGKVLNRSKETIARAARLLLRSGDIVACCRTGRSYAWAVLLEESDVLSDPSGICKVKTPVKNDHTERSLLTGALGKHDSTDLSEMTGVPLEGEEVTSPDMTVVCGCSEEASREALYMSSLDADTKNMSQDVKPAEATALVAVTGDDDPVDYKALMKRLEKLGIGQRMVRKLLREKSHRLVHEVLERASLRPDLENPAGYVITEVQDGGYEYNELAYAAEVATKAIKSQPMVEVKVAPVAAEMTQKAPERAERSSGIKELLDRYNGLSEDLRAQLKASWKAYLQRSVSSTKRKEKILADPAIQRATWREVMQRFFGAVDDGMAAEGALLQLAA